MTRALAVMTDQHWGEYPDAAEPADLSPGAPPFCPEARAHAVRNLIRHRRRREQLFGDEVFADPVWDILLDLYASHYEGKNVAVTSLCIAAAVPPTTALRWIKVMTEKGWRRAGAARSLFRRAAGRLIGLLPAGQSEK